MTALNVLKKCCPWHIYSLYRSDSLRVARIIANILIRETKRDLIRTFRAPFQRLSAARRPSFYILVWSRDTTHHQHCKHIWDFWFHEQKAENVKKVFFILFETHSEHATRRIILVSIKVVLRLPFISIIFADIRLLRLCLSKLRECKFYSILLAYRFTITHYSKSISQNHGTANSLL